jgi:hypothetical protein
MRDSSTFSVAVLRTYVHKYVRQKIRNWSYFRINMSVVELQWHVRYLPAIISDKPRGSKEMYCNSYVNKDDQKKYHLSGDHPLVLVLLLVPSRLYVTDRASKHVHWFLPAYCSAVSGIHCSWVSNISFHEDLYCRLAMTTLWTWQSQRWGGSNSRTSEIILPLHFPPFYWHYHALNGLTLFKFPLIASCAIYSSYIPLTWLQFSGLHRGTE